MPKLVELLRDVPLDPRRTVLLAVGFQRLFLAEDGPQPNPRGDELVRALNRLTAAVRARGVGVVFSHYVLRDDLADAGLLAGNAVVREGHMCAGSSWTRVDPRAHVAAEDVQLRRNRPSAFSGADLGELLERRGTRALIVPSVSANNALSATVRDAFARDLPCVIPRECVGVAPPETTLAAGLEILDTWTAEVTAAETIVTRLDERC